MVKKKVIKLYSLEGIKLSSIYSGMYKKKRLDLSIIELDEKSIVSGIFTKNKAKSPSVIISEKHLKIGKPRYLIINSGNANAGTGIDGIKDIEKYCKKLEKEFSCNFKDILVFSTGVIGERIKKRSI